MKLYELAKQYQEAVQMVDEDGCLTDKALQLIDKSKLSIEEKGKNIAIIMQEMDNNAEVIDQEIKRLQAMKKAQVNNKQRLKDYLSDNLQRAWIEEVKTELFKINFRKSDSVEVEEWILLPEEFTNIKISPNKTAIKAALKKWVKIEWCTLKESKNLQIK